jgi:hypothetical protein
MANEATMVEGPYETHDFTVADGATISAMNLLVLSDPRTGAASTTALAPAFAGIAATDKLASNGKTELGCYTKGIFVLTAATGASISAGEAVVLSGANLIKEATEANMITGSIVGKALESIASGTTGEVHVGVI